MTGSLHSDFHHAEKGQLTDGSTCIACGVCIVLAFRQMNTLHRSDCRTN